MTRPSLVRLPVREHHDSAPPVLSVRRPPRCAMVSTFPPTQCGLATFAQALASGFEEVGAAVDVVPVPSAPAAVAARLNRADVVILQHEYGIYAGPDGEQVLDLLRELTVPVVSVLHTVLQHPTPRQHELLRQVIQASATVVTMTRTARSRAIELYGAAPERTVVIPHGAAADLVSAPQPAAAAAAADEPPVVLTWGLLGRGKGIEWAIRAMASLADLAPSPVYVVAGRTHPRLDERDGRQYRRELVGLAAELGISARVAFDDRYLAPEALLDLVRRADVVLLPYDSVEQVTSGVLTEAVAAGKPVISTRFPHAVELLGDGTGLLVDRADPAGIAQALRRVLTDGELARQLAGRAHRLGPGLTWRAVAHEYLGICAAAQRPGIADGRPVVPSAVRAHRRAVSR
jgi:polysaccharide biosynthesis protein PslF